MHAHAAVDPLRLQLAVGSALVAIVAHRAGVLANGHVGIEVLFAVIGAYVADRGLQRLDASHLVRQFLHLVALPTVFLLVLLSGYANWFADDGELSLLRGTTLWSIVGFGDVHASLASGQDAADSASIQAAGHLWIPAAAFRFAVLWWGLSTLVRISTRTAPSHLREVITARRLLMVSLVLFALVLIGAAWAAGTATPAALFSSPILRSAGLLGGAAVALAHRSAIRFTGSSTRGSDTWVAAPFGALVVLALLPGTETAATLSLTVVLAALCSALLLVAFGADRGDAPSRATGARIGVWGPALAAQVEVAIVAFALHGPVLALAQHRGLASLSALVITCGASVALAVPIRAASSWIVAAPARIESVLVVLVPIAFAAVLLLFASTGALHHEPPRWIPGWDPPPAT